VSGAVASRYARAIFELGAETDTADGLIADIANAAAAYGSSVELQNALENPLVPHAAKRGIVTDFADALGIGQLAKNTLLLLSDRRRLRVLPSVAKRLGEMSDLKKGIVHAEVVTAAPLGEAYYTRLQQQLEKMTGKQVSLDRREDPALIAGVITRIGDTVYDGSLRSRLESLKNALLPN
jgi:F-type H+-transporting ATPase subunit delta